MDQTGALVSGVSVRDQTGRAEALAVNGRPFRELVPDEAWRILEPQAEAALAGEFAETELVSGGGDAIRFSRVSFLPRFQDLVRRRGFVVIVRDVTEAHRQAAQEVQRREELDAMLGAAADAILTIDVRGRIESANSAAEDLFGAAMPGELNGRPVTALMDEPYRSSHQAYIGRYLDTGQSGILHVGPRRLPARRLDGTPVPIELSIGETWVGDRRLFVGVCRDISARLAIDEERAEANWRMAEQIETLERLGADLEAQRAASQALAEQAEAARGRAQAADLAKTRFIAKASHELRTPLNGVLAVADLLAGHELPDGAAELVGILQRSGRDLLHLLNEILDLSKAESGGLKLIPEPFRLAELVSSVADVWTVAAEAKGLRLRLVVDDPGPGLLGDSSRLRQILGNLVNNAVKFTEAGEVRLTAQVAAGDSGFADVVLRVEDTGPGLDETLAGRLFEPFAEGASPRARRNAGAGLGLAICRELVELMGGGIEATPRPEGGLSVEVRLTLPIAEAALAPAAPAAVGADLAGLRVLVAEDHPVNRRVMELMLSQFGVRARYVEDGETALAAVAEEPFDAILMDVQMPRMDGVEATRRIRLLPGDAGRTPIAAVTADPVGADSEVMRAPGFDAVLGKPISAAGLAATLGRLADLARSRVPPTAPSAQQW